MQNLLGGLKAFGVVTMDTVNSIQSTKNQLGPGARGHQRTPADAAPGATGPESTARSYGDADASSGGRESMWADVPRRREQGMGKDPFYTLLQLRLYLSLYFIQNINIRETFHTHFPSYGTVTLFCLQYFSLHVKKNMSLLVQKENYVNCWNTFYFL